jgi:hypothetical protein
MAVSTRVMLVGSARNACLVELLFIVLLPRVGRHQLPLACLGAHATHIHAIYTHIHAIYTHIHAIYTLIHAIYHPHAIYTHIHAIYHIHAICTHQVILGRKNAIP